MVGRGSTLPHLPIVVLSCAAQVADFIARHAKALKAVLRRPHHHGSGGGLDGIAAPALREIYAVTTLLNLAASHRQTLFAKVSLSRCARVPRSVFHQHLDGAASRRPSRTLPPAPPHHSPTARRWALIRYGSSSYWGC